MNLHIETRDNSGLAVGVKSVDRLCNLRRDVEIARNLRWLILCSGYYYFGFGSGT